MVRCACRADRLDCARFWAFCWPFAPVAAPGAPLAGPGRGWPSVTGPRGRASPVGGLPAGAAGAGAGAEAEELGLAGGGFFAVTPERRKARAGDDGEFGGGSGISQAKAAGGTDDASGTEAAEPESDERGADDPGPDVAPAAGTGASLAGFTADSAG